MGAHPIRQKENEKVVAGGQSGMCSECHGGGSLREPFEIKDRGVTRYRTCGDCGKTYRKTYGFNDNVTFLVVPPGTIASTKFRRVYDPSPRAGMRLVKIRPIVWKLYREGKRNYVYFPCQYCGEINRIPANDIGLDGVLIEDGNPVCVQCPMCLAHFWPWFKDFDPIGGGA